MYDAPHIEESPKHIFDPISTKNYPSTDPRMSRQNRKGLQDMQFPNNRIDRSSTPDKIGGFLSQRLAKSTRTSLKKDSIDVKSIKAEIKGTAFSNRDETKAQMEQLEKEIKGFEPTHKLDDFFLADDEMDQEVLCHFVLNEI